MITFWAYLRFHLLLWSLRAAWRVLRWLVTAAILVAAAPVTVVAAVAFAGAWLRGWPPAKLWRAAAWALPMTGVYLAGRAVQVRTWTTLALVPVHDWRYAWHLAHAARLVPAVVLCAPLAVPAGLATAALAWAWRIYTLETGLTGRTATAPVAFDARQWQRQARSARARITAPGSVPLTNGQGRVVMGATIRAVGHRWHPVHAIPYTAMGRHQVVLGSSGSGKTNLMMRTWAGWYAAARTAHLTAGAPRPLLLVLDCKGGPDSRAKAARTRRLLHATGAGRVAVWPDEATVSLWALPPRDLAVTLFQMLETGTGNAAYYADITQAVLTLAVTAPAGRPPAGPSSWPGSTWRGWGPSTPATRPGWPLSVPPETPCPISACATGLSCPGSVLAWTGRARWPRRMPGISSSKAPASRPSPKHKLWP